MRSLRTVVGLCLAAGAALLGACNRSGDAQDLKPTTTTFLTGTSSVPPDLEGTWVVQSTPGAAGCGPLHVLYVTPTVLSIGPAAKGAFEFSAVDSCGRPIPGGSGTISTTGEVALSAAAEDGLTATCVLKLTRRLRGAVESPPNIFTGSDVLNVSASDQPGSNQCAATLPCAVRGSFTATRCPASGCTVTCTP